MNPRPDDEHSQSYRQIMERLDGLINQQSFGQAVLSGSLWLASSGSLPDDAHFWFKMFLAASLDGDEQGAEMFAARATQCSNFDDEMHGDHLRDRMNMGMHLRRRGTAPYTRTFVFGHLDEAERLHKGSPRLIADYIIRGKAHYYFGEFHTAVVVFKRAWELSAQFGHPNPQWDRNLRFHCMRACARAGNTRQAREYARLILQDSGEHAASRKKAARLISLSATIGCRLIDYKEDASRR